ncbi:hypothetical protein P3X46_004138 [Hevea brasiliensis]|uniref:AT-hook motif nuclear-localized protein n=1 Tax=Hevea brasiliensis TaxID=3981 RepID=A0ABQ9MY31_HEVBR|nr:hypothetical protein P3X46_004138 [Hevea brasiliensis]
MEEKESTITGLPGYSETDSLPVSSVVMPQVMTINMNMAAENMSMERSLIATTTPPTTGIDGPDGGSGHPASGSEDLIGKKNRVRPKKYDSDGRVQPFHHHKAVPRGALTSPPAGLSFSPSPPSDGLISSLKRCRGRPLALVTGSDLFANTAGADFTPHVVTVNTGEDVAGKILAFAQKGPRGICILSANGAVSNVTIRQPGSSHCCRQLHLPNEMKAHKRKHHRENAIGSGIPVGAQEVPTEARPISETKPVGETCLISASSLPEQSHEGADNSASDQQISNAANPFTSCLNGSQHM